MAPRATKRAQIADAAYDRIGEVLVSAGERMKREGVHLTIVHAEWKTRGRSKYRVFLAACCLRDEVCGWRSDLTANGGHDSAIRFTSHDDARAAGLEHEVEANARPSTEERAS